jgi:DNA-binding transcriptional LysR family regulator
MNLQHLRVFVAVAEAGRIGEAAEHLGTSQPAVSRQVAALERTLGLRLLDRLPRGVRLTEAGRLLLEHARRVFTAERSAEDALAEFRGLQRGRLCFGASLTIGSYLLPPALVAFHGAHPAIEIEQVVANTAEIQQRLLAGSLDFAMTEGLVESELLTSRVFHRDRLVLVVGRSHPLARRRRIASAELPKHPLILREPGSGTRVIVEQALRRKRVTPTIAMSLGSAEAIKATVALGECVAIVSELAVRDELSSGSLVEVTMHDLAIRRELHLLRRTDHTRSPAADAFLQIVDRLLQMPAAAARRPVRAQVQRGS